jgi:hypothetical protein
MIHSFNLLLQATFILWFVEPTNQHDGAPLVSRSFHLCFGWKIIIGVVA